MGTNCSGDLILGQFACERDFLVHEIFIVWLRDTTCVNKFDKIGNMELVEHFV